MCSIAAYHLNKKSIIKVWLTWKGNKPVTLHTIHLHDQVADQGAWSHHRFWQASPTYSTLRTAIYCGCPQLSTWFRVPSHRANSFNMHLMHLQLWLFDLFQTSFQFRLAINRRLKHWRIDALPQIWNMRACRKKTKRWLKFMTHL